MTKTDSVIQRTNVSTGVVQTEYGKQVMKVVNELEVAAQQVTEIALIEGWDPNEDETFRYWQQYAKMMQQKLQDAIERDGARNSLVRRKGGTQ